MIKLKEQHGPFEQVTVTKRAYDLSNIEPDRYRKEIKNYVENLYPYLAPGLQYVNFKKPPDDNGDAIGFIEYQGNGINITIPIIIDENNLKEPTLGIYNGHVIPIDKEYNDYIIETPEYGEQIRENELPANMQYITQSGLFQSNDSGVYKGAGDVIDTIFEEDANNPYHYYGALLKHAADNTISVEDGVYCDSATMLKLIKCAEDKNNSSKPASIADDKRVREMPVVQKLTESGKYRNVMLGDRILAADVLCDLFSIEGGKTKSLVIFSKGQECNQIERLGEKHVNEEEAWGYGNAYGSGYEGGNTYRWRYFGNDNTIDDVINKTIVFSRPRVNTEEGGYSHTENAISTPYIVQMMESVRYGDSGDTAKVLCVDSINDGSKYKFIISDKVAEVRKISNAKLKNSSLNYLYDKLEDVYLIPASYGIHVLPTNKQEMGNSCKCYERQVASIAKSYPNNMSIISKGAGLYTIDVSGPDVEYKYANVSEKAALLLANYYTGQRESNMSDYQMYSPYAFNGDITKHAVCRKNVKPLKKYKGEYRKLAQLLNSYRDDVKKVAAISEAVDKLVGIEAAIDDEHIDTSNALQLIDNIISKIGELLLMSRLGKNDISESILSRAMYAMVKLSNEIRGLSNTNAF